MTRLKMGKTKHPIVYSLCPMQISVLISASETNLFPLLNDLSCFNLEVQYRFLFYLCETNLFQILNVLSCFQFGRPMQICVLSLRAKQICFRFFFNLVVQLDPMQICVPSLRYKFACSEQYQATFRHSLRVWPISQITFIRTSYQYQYLSLGISFTRSQRLCVLYRFSLASYLQYYAN